MIELREFFSLSDRFETFLIELEKLKKRKLIKRIAKASAKDSIGDGTIDDGIN